MEFREKLGKMSLIMCQYNSREKSAEKCMEELMKIFEPQWLSLWKYYTDRKKSKKAFRNYLTEIGFIR